ncbi:hypothetical protein [Ekhidna sp. To15]|uniref:hypothetical protein n=1 Tax=Ekhidna sp. To15 TaxID=3395267 RepID=UPI003F51ADBB
MRNSIIIILVAFLVVSCQIEDDNAPTPDEAYIKYYGDLTSFEARDIEIVYDQTGEIAEGLVVFGMRTNESGDDDYFVLRTDLEGNFVDSVYFGFENATDRDFTGDGIPDIFKGVERAGQIHSIPGGGFITIGTSSITETVLDISDFQILTVGFLDADLNLQNDTLLALVSEVDNVELDLIGNDVIVLSDGSLLLAGAKEFDRGGGVTDFDNYFLKFNFTDGVIFENTQGVAGEDENDILVRAFEKASGNIVLIGYSNSPSLLGENEGNNGTNAYYLEISPNGTPVNFAAYGFEDPNSDVVFNENVNNVIQTSSGYSIVGTSMTSQNENFSFVMNLSNNGIYLSGSNHLVSTYNGENNIVQTQGLGVTQAANNDIVMVGQYEAFVSGNLSRGGEGMFVKFDQAANPIAGAESFFGLADGNDSVVDAVTLPDGKIAAVANVDFGGGVKLISIIKLNDNGSLD